MKLKVKPVSVWNGRSDDQSCWIVFVFCLLLSAAVQKFTIAYKCGEGKRSFVSIKEMIPN